MAKINTSPLAKQVYRIIREKIISRQYVAGDKLDIQTLAETFGVSRSPVKDAINDLVHDGLIEVIPRKGTYVTELDLTSFLEVLDARLMIEKWAGEKIIENSTPEQLEKLKEITAKMDQVLEKTPFSFDHYVELDMKFHKLLIEWTHNERVKEIYFSLNTHVSLSRIVYSTSLESTIHRHQDHIHLVEAIEAKQVDAFHQTIEQHIQSLKKEAIERWDHD